MAIELSIRDLTLITKGKLRLGLTPPLGGEFEPIGRLLHPTDKLRKGDVVIAPLENEYFSEARKENRELEKQDWAESSFATGAFGIISTRDICPWNGCFSIQVDDLEAAVWNLVTFVREISNQPIVLLLDQRDDSPIAKTMQESGVNGNGDRSLVWQLFELQKQTTNDDHSFVQIKSNSDFQVAKDLFMNPSDVSVLTEYADLDSAAEIQAVEMTSTTKVIRERPGVAIITDVLKQLSVNHKKASLRGHK